MSSTIEQDSKHYQVLRDHLVEELKKIIPHLHLESMIARRGRDWWVNALRADESVQIEDTFVDHFGVPLIHVNAAERFLTALDDIAEPERRRPG